MKATGKVSLSLFNCNLDLERKLRLISNEALFEKLGLAKPDKKQLDAGIPITPQLADFAYFPFRHLSAGIVAGGTWRATDFSDEAVLKRSKNLLQNKPAYKNHYQMVGEEIGYIGETEWVKSYTHPEFGKIPAGIEAPFIIDSVLEPDLCRKLNWPISPIQSCSVTVIFEWEASHDFEHEGDFYYHLGEMVDGEMVRRIVVNILDYGESSLVWQGADPFAKMLDKTTGKIIDVDRTAQFSKPKFGEDLSLEKWESKRLFFAFDSMSKKELLNLSKSFEENKPTPENVNTMDKDLLALLASLFGTTSENLEKGTFKKGDAEKYSILKKEDFTKMKSADDFQKEVDAKVKAEASVVTLTGEVTTLKGEKKVLEDAATLAKPKVDMADSLVTKSKEEAKRIYGIFAKGKPDAAIVTEIEGETTLEKLEAKIKMWGGQALTEFGGQCNKCKSNDISFRSSKTNPEDSDGEGEESFDLRGSLEMR